MMINPHSGIQYTKQGVNEHRSVWTGLNNYFNDNTPWSIQQSIRSELYRGLTNFLDAAAWNTVGLSTSDFIDPA